MSTPDPVAAMYSAQAAFTALVESLDEDAWGRSTPCPGWNVHDIVSHIWGTERMMAGDSAPDVDLTMVDTSHVSGGLAEMNEQWVVAGRENSREQALEALRDVFARRRNQLDAMSEDELEEPTDSPIGRVPYRDFMGVRAFDTAIHELDIRDAVGMPPRFDGDEWRVAVGMVLGSLPRTVGKKAAAEEGARVRFVIHDDPADDVDIVVREGRAKSEPADPGTGPSLTLTTDVGTLVRAACGRQGARLGEPGEEPTPGDGEKPGSIAVTGDTDLARRIIAELPFVR